MAQQLTCPITGQQLTEQNECVSIVTESGNFFVNMGDLGFAVYVSPTGNALRQTDLSEWNWLRQKVGSSKIVFVARPDIQKDFQEIGDVWEDIDETQRHIGTVTQYADGSFKCVFDTVCWHSYPGAVGRKALSPIRVEHFSGIDNMPSEYFFKPY